MSPVHCAVSVHVCLLISVWLPTGVILQARCVVAVRQAARPVGRTPPTASAVKNLSSYTSTSVWRSVLQRTLCGTGSANTAPQPVRSATHSGSAQVLEHNANENKFRCSSLFSLINNLLSPLCSPLRILLPGSVVLVIFSHTSNMALGLAVLVSWLVHHFDPNLNKFWMYCHDILSTLSRFPDNVS